MANVKEAKLKDLIQDDRNLNAGTERGQQLIEKSLREFGAGRSILLDKNNRIIAGNKTHKNAELARLKDGIRNSCTGNIDGYVYRCVNYQGRRK